MFLPTVGAPGESPVSPISYSSRRTASTNHTPFVVMLKSSTSRASLLPRASLFVKQDGVPRLLVSLPLPDNIYPLTGVIIHCVLYFIHHDSFLRRQRRISFLSLDIRCSLRHSCRSYRRCSSLYGLLGLLLQHLRRWRHRDCCLDKSSFPPLTRGFFTLNMVLRTVSNHFDSIDSLLLLYSLNYLMSSIYLSLHLYCLVFLLPHQ